MNTDQLQNDSNAGQDSSCDLLRRFLPGPLCIINTSARLAWKYLSLEKHRHAPGEREESSIDAHVISMLCGPQAVFGYRTRSGGLISQVKQPETIGVNPIGKVPKLVFHSPSEFIHIVLKKAFVEEVLDELGHSATPPQEFTSGLRDSGMVKLIRLLSEEAEADMPTGEMYVDALAHALALRYVKLNQTVTKAFQTSQPSGLPLLVLNRVRDKMKANLSANLRLDDLAREAGYSSGHFLRMFRASTGMTPHKFMVQLRVEHARSLLKESKLRLVEVAIACGFSSHAHMTYVFRKTLGAVPTELRRHTVELPPTSGESSFC